MNVIQRCLFNTLVLAIKTYQRLFLDLHVHGREHIPPGPKIYMINHITSTDPYWVMPVFTEPVHVIIGPGYESKLMGWALNYMQQINAMPDHRHAVVEEAVRYLQKGESIFTAPEGDIQVPFSLGRFYPGVAKIYRRIQVPIIPIALVAPPRALKAYPKLDITVEGRVYRGVFVLRGPYYINVGKPFMPESRYDLNEKEGQQRFMEELKDRIAQLVDEVRTEHDL